MTARTGGTYVFGGWYDEVQYGTDGRDFFVGGFGALGDLGNDLMLGGAGDDTLCGGEGVDTLDGGAGSDRADYGGATGAVTIDLGAGTAFDGRAVDTLVAIEQAWGSPFDDSIVGGAGADVLCGGAGADTLDGGEGYDTVSFADATGAVGVDLALGTASGRGGDTLRNIEAVRGGAAGDALTGSAAANLLDGGAGNDTLCGGAGNDTLVGGGGTDTAVFGGVLANYRLTQLADGRLAVTDLRTTAAATGTDTLAGIRDLAFADQVLHLAAADRLVAMGAHAPAVVTLPDGSYAIAVGSADGILFCRYGADGTPQGGTALVNTVIAGTQQDVAVTGLYDGGWVAAWRTDGDVALQRFHADGSRAGAEVALAGTGPQLAPAVTATIDGGFVVAWQATGADGSQDVYARRFDAEGVAQGDVTVNTTVAGDQLAPVVAEQDNGSMVAWRSVEGAAHGVRVQQYCWDGTAAGGEVTLASAGAIGALGIATLYGAGGTMVAGTVVGWIQDDGDGATPDDAVLVQRFDGAGTALGTPVVVASDGFQHEMAVTGLHDGGFVVVWDAVAAGGAAAILARCYGADGTASGAAWQVNQGTLSGQPGAVTVAETADGRLVVGWSDAQDRVWQQQLGCDGQAEFVAATGTAQPLLLAQSAARALPEVAWDGAVEAAPIGVHTGAYCDIALL